MLLVSFPPPCIR
uniref:Uncharacterized protein LOC105139562 n=1 Tax=Rhizophora mucronata TaxID=61149 RepID=A0A2P2J3G9_RHIMU